MARPRKPTKLLAITGGYDKNPGRLSATRGDEPFEQRALGEPPPHLDAKQRVTWAEIERIAPEGVLTHADRLIVEIAAVLLARFRRCGELMPIVEVTRLQSILGELGLTPAARSKVVPVGGRNNRNRFAGIGSRPPPDPPAKKEKPCRTP
jgi:phage terminase small subunit